MKSKLYLWLFCLLVSAQSYSQKNKQVELVLRDSIAYIKGSDMPYTGIGVVYADDLLEEKIHYVDGIRNGLTTKYVNTPNTIDSKGRVSVSPLNGILIYEVNYKQGVKDGMEYVYSAYGDVLENVNYIKGHKDGMERTFRDYNRSRNIVMYKNGSREGVSLGIDGYYGVLYYANFVNDKEEGKVIGRYFANTIPYGSSVSKYFYSKGKLESVGLIEGMGYKAEVNFKNGKRDGISVSIDDVKKVELFVNGKLEGVTKIYKGAFLESEISYRNGKAHGVCKEYNYDGDVVEEIYYNYGMRVSKVSDIKSVVFKDVAVDEDSLVIKKGIAYLRECIIPYTGKTERYRGLGNFVADVFYKDGIKVKEVEYYNGFLYGELTFQNGFLKGEKYLAKRGYKTDYVFTSVHSHVPKVDKAVVRMMYAGGESGNGELNIDSESENWKTFQVNVVNGRREGVRNTYVEGQTTSYEIMNYVNNKKEGEAIYERKGMEKFVRNYRKGLQEGEFLQYKGNNELVLRSFYKDGEESGDRITYYSDTGTIERKVSYKYSLMHGEFLEYNKKRQLIIEDILNMALLME